MTPSFPARRSSVLVTAWLDGSGGPDNPPSWGRWFRQIEGDTNRGNVLMEGVGKHPLLILDRFGEGRVAQIMSDHMWLWARGFEGGGPQAELLRRISHRSEEHTSELQSLMRISYAVFCLNKKTPTS